MRRLLFGLGSLVFLFVATIMVVPLFLPKEQIKRQVVEEVDKRLGWRVRLDGPVSLSLFPSFSLVADDIGLSGEAGADGIEFAKAKRMEFGLGWAGLLTGNIKVTGLTLVEPDILLEVGANGTTSWEPRRDLELEADAGTDEATEPSEATTSDTAATPAASGDGSPEPARKSARYLKSVGIDQLAITGGTLTYKEASGGQSIRIADLNLTVAAPDLSGDATLESSFTLQETPLTVSGVLNNPIGLASGRLVPVDLTVSSGDNTVKLTGEGGIDPVQATLIVNATGPSLKALAALAGQGLETDPGSYSIDAKISGQNETVSVADLDIQLGELSLAGAADFNYAGLVPEASGRLLLKNGSVADLLSLAGKDLPATGTLGADIAFEAVGMTAEELLAGLDINGAVTISDGEIGGLGLASAVGGDPEADRITNLALNVDLNGLEQPISLSGALSWRGEAFSVTGEADMARLLRGTSAPISISVKGNRVSAGFDGQVASAGAIDGAVRVDTQDLRGLMAWMGQPIGAGGGLKTFKASGIFGMQDDAISFEETRFTLDETSGEANGRIKLGGKPSVTAMLALRELVLDPYLGKGSKTGGAAAAPSGSSQGAAAPSSGSGGAQPVGGGNAGAAWSTDRIDFSGLNAVDADFKVTANAIRWDRIKVGESALSATIKDGILTANLEKMSLYGGEGSGNVKLNGAASTPAVITGFALSGLDAAALLQDAADFDWIEGKAAISLDLKSSGASEQALMEGLTGKASYTFSDGAIRGINIPKMVRGLSVETLLGWQDTAEEKTDFSTLSASFKVEEGIARTDDLSLVGPLVRMTGKGTTNIPKRTLAWRVEPKIVPTLQGDVPQPRRKGEDKKLAGLGVPIVIEGSWDDPRIYPDIKGILENPEAAYEQLQNAGGELISILKGKKEPSENLVETANEVIERATGGRTQIDIQKVIDGDVNDEEVLKAVEEGFGLPSGLLGNVLGKKKKNDN
ncbi:AsmA family protein [Rhodobacterales bacterium]|nr:AsmA family protein [Rhodobacterales bacterium]